MYAGQEVETGPRARRVRDAAPSVHAGVAGRAARTQRRTRAPAGHSRRGAGPARPSHRLPAVAALHVRGGALPARHAADGRQRRTPRALPLPARRRRTPHRRLATGSGCRDEPAGPPRNARRRSAASVGAPLTATLLEARALTRHYRVSHGMFRPKGLVRALDGVSFTLRAGETLAVVGESGCGKSTLARQVTMIERPTSGAASARRAGRRHGERGERKRLRPLVQMVFQNPFASLNPRKKVGTMLKEPLVINTTRSAAERREAARAMMARVGLRPEHYRRYPHMFSGGQRQRIAVARALMLQPAAGRRRRAGVGARRVDPGAGAEPADGPAAGNGRRLPVHLAQPAGRAPHRRRGPRHVPGQDRRARTQGDDLRPPGASVHAGAAGEHAVAVRRGAGRARAADRRTPVAARIRPAAAPSTSAARTRFPAARSRCRCWRRSGRRASPAIAREN